LVEKLWHVVQTDLMSGRTVKLQSFTSSFFMMLRVKC